eukprot:CAMPEP_0170554928 /NCGR_PEP_ID=MMETSP0211-20121228/12801_1 /TAXON_ID=311385 /ORGANISM="Pseudokeronopsis sp., Strain OXSARD2" /LENGTH=112 /DNA_ID=CAMNT_0010864371 /DNA_START=988 /DNA_END=1326 /DNA_ORIENTATION=-
MELHWSFIPREDDIRKFGVEVLENYFQAVLRRAINEEEVVQHLEPVYFHLFIADLSDQEMNYPQSFFVEFVEERLVRSVLIGQDIFKSSIVEGLRYIESHLGLLILIQKMKG